jgi:hypothetical protein
MTVYGVRLFKNSNKAHCSSRQHARRHFDFADNERKELSTSARGSIPTTLDVCSYQVLADIRRLSTEKGVSQSVAPEPHRLFTTLSTEEKVCTS